MVEKEAARSQDRSMVASVFINRMKLGMSLGLISLNDPGLVDKLIIICSDSGIIKLAGKMKTNEEIARLRADYLRKALKRAKV